MVAPRLLLAAAPYAERAFGVHRRKWRIPDLHVQAGNYTLLQCGRCRARGHMLPGDGEPRRSPVLLTFQVDRARAVLNERVGAAMTRGRHPSSRGPVWRLMKSRYLSYVMASKSPH